MRVVELSYTSPYSGHDWVLRYPPRMAKKAIDAVFRWYYTVEEFGVLDLEEFLRSILQDAVESGQATEYARDFAAELVYEVAKSGLTNKSKANLIRHIVRSAIESPA